MLFGLFSRRTRDNEHKIYCEIVAQARQQAFYTLFQVPDTIDGRFDLIVAHAVLLFRRLRGESEQVSEFAQNVFDLFFDDMDASLREMGISDTRVPKKVKVMGEAFYGRADAYIPPIEERDVGSLAEALGRNIYTDARNPGCERALARYMIAAAEALEAQRSADILKGTLSWPTPEDPNQMDTQNDS